MTSLIAGTWSIISSSAEVITGARRMTLRIQKLLTPGLVELSESDRRRLVSLQTRVESLVQPLNFLVLWSKRRDSCVHQVVLQAQELLLDVSGYVDRFVPQDITVPTAFAGCPVAGAGIDSNQLDYYLRELEFTCVSISMAVSIARAHDADPLTQPQSSASRSESSGGSDRNGVSLSALLRASRRIQDMCGRSGDMCACPGRLFVATTVPLPDVPIADSGSSAVCGRPDGHAGEEWTPMFSYATLKVTAKTEEKGRRKFTISVDNRVPLNPRDSSPIRDEGRGSPEKGLNNCTTLSFPIEVALDAHLATSGRMCLPERVRGALDPGIDALVLVWTGSETTKTEDVCAEFPDAVVVHDVDSSSRPRSAALQSRCAEEAPGQRFAFVFDGSQGAAESRAGDADVALTPLDTMYLARLCAADCALDDGHPQSPEACCPPHLMTSDEVLLELLRDGHVVVK